MISGLNSNIMPREPTLQKKNIILKKIRITVYDQWFPDEYYGNYWDISIHIQEFCRRRSEKKG